MSINLNIFSVNSSKNSIFLDLIHGPVVDGDGGLGVKCQALVRAIADLLYCEVNANYYKYQDCCECRKKQDICR